MSFALFGSLGTTEILIIAGLVIALLVTGQLPGAARFTGQVIRRVRGVRQQVDHAKSDAIDRLLRDDPDRDRKRND